MQQGSIILQPRRNPAPALVFGIPAEDIREFSALPDATRDSVRWLLQSMRVIASAKAKTAACQEVADAGGVHFNTIYPKWKAFRDSGDWRKLIDKRRTSEFWRRDESKRIGLPDKFVTFWKGLVDDNDRAAKPARIHLIDRWRRWRSGDRTQAIPGYERCPDPAPGSMCPMGWSYSNLLHYMPSDIEIAASTKGRSAALALIPGVMTTRVGSYPFAEIQFDDMWHNFQINVPGYKSSYRLLEFGAVDFCSSFIFSPGLKPRLPEVVTEGAKAKMRQLNGRDFHLYLINWLLDYGAHPDGTVLNVENGTAAISRAFEEKLLLWFDGRVTVTRSGMSGAPAFPGAYSERAKGNYKAKALKEGLGNYIQNVLGAVPGQVGMNRDDCPAALTGRQHENEMLLALTIAMPDLRDKLRLGFLDLADAVFAVNDVYRLINGTFDHNTEGWEDCGFVIEEYRFSSQSDDWRPASELLSLPHHEQSMVAMACRMDPTLRRRRKLSRAEAMMTGMPRLIRLPHEAVPDLLGPEYGAVRTAAGGKFDFTWQGLGKLRFLATYQDQDGFVRRVPNGGDVLTHLNPWKPEFLYLTDPKTGRFLGRAARDNAITRGDVDAIHARHGQAQRELKEATLELAARQGLKRIPHLKQNAAAIRTAARPSIRDQALASAGFDASGLLDDPEAADELAPAAFPGILNPFDVSDLL